MQIHSPELYLNAILLLINDRTDVSLDAVKRLLEIAENSKERDLADNEMTKLYIRIIKGLIQSNVSKDTPDELRVFILRFKDDQRMKTDRATFEILHDAFTSPNRMNRDRIVDIRTTLNNAVLWNKANTKTKELFGALIRTEGIDDPYQMELELRKLSNFSDGLTQTLTNHASTDTDLRTNFPGLIQSINMRSKEDMRVVVETEKQIVREGAFKLGLQGLNRMFGKSGGPVRGESCAFNAMSHHYKSGMLISIARWIVLYNAPPKVAPGMRPLMWVTSLENEAWRDAMDVFRNSYASETLKSAQGMSDDDIIAWTSDKFQQNGWEFLIERFLPQDFGYEEYVQRYRVLNSLGFEVVCSVVDYMNNMKKPRADRADMQVRLLYNYMCNFTKSQKTSLFTAHQLNRDAMRLEAEGVTNLVKRLGPAYLSDSTDVQREVDFTAFMHIEVGSDNAPYLTVSRGKHRYVPDTPPRDKYTAYRFYEDLGICDDVLREDCSVKDIYAVAAASNDKAHIIELGDDLY